MNLLSDGFAAFLADAGIFAVDRFMRNASRFIASGANELNFADVKGHLLRDNAALRNLKAGLGMAFNLIDALDDDLAFRGQGGNNFALFPLILAGENDDGVALFNVKFNESQDEPSFLKNFGSEGDNFHEIFIAKFASDGSENTSAARSFIVFDDDGGIFVETDIGTVLTAKALFGANDDGLNNVALFNLAAGSGGFNGGNDDVADIGIATEGAAEHANAHNFFSAGIIADVKSGLLLNQDETS